MDKKGLPLGSPFFVLRGCLGEYSRISSTCPPSFPHCFWEEVPHNVQGKEEEKSDLPNSLYQRINRKCHLERDTMTNHHLSLKQGPTVGLCFFSFNHLPCGSTTFLAVQPSSLRFHFLFGSTLLAVPTTRLKGKEVFLL